MDVEPIVKIHLDSQSLIRGLPWDGSIGQHGQLLKIFLFKGWKFAAESG